MLHLAQVQNNQSVGGVELRLLASQQSENSWAVIDPESVLLNNADSLQEGLLVLVDLSDNKEVLRIQHAQDWVLDLVQKYLTGRTASTFLQEEAERAEQWRQELTLQSQDWTRRNLELAAQREQLQALEEDFKQERQQLEKLGAQLEQEKRQLEEKAAQVKQKTDSEHF